MDWNVPAMAPPPGVLPNLKDPESRAYESIVTTAVCVSLMMPFFMLRLYSRIFVTRSLGWDDCKIKSKKITFGRAIPFY